MRARSPSTALTPPRSAVIGVVTCLQCFPVSVVTSRTPFLPAIQQTFFDGADPDVSDAFTPLTCSFHSFFLGSLFCRRATHGLSGRAPDRWCWRSRCCRLLGSACRCLYSLCYS